MKQSNKMQKLMESMKECKLSPRPFEKKIPKKEIKKAKKKKKIVKRED